MFSIIFLKFKEEWDSVVCLRASLIDFDFNWSSIKCEVSEVYDCVASEDQPSVVTAM